jgi:hypothetical protein
VFLIGAANDCDLVLGDLQFPEAYAYLFAQDDHITIRRLGSGPELCVGGEAVDSAELFHGELVAFGPFELRVVIEPGAANRNAKGRPVLGRGDDADVNAAILDVQSLLAEIRRALAADLAFAGAEQLEAGWRAGLSTPDSV